MIALENKAAGKVSDSLLNYEAVKYFNNEKHEGSTYETTLLQYQKKALKAASSMSALNFGQNAIFSMGLMMIMYLTLRNVKAGLATVGDLVLVNGLLFQLSVPLNFIGWVYQEVKQAFIDMEAMFDLRDTKPEINDDPNAVEYVPSKDGTTIEFDEIEFAYNAAEAMPVGNGNLLHEEQLTRRPILKKTSFTIPQGKTVAIVGASGSGKSTLLRLLYRFYTPDEGLIRIGGKDASQYTTESVRKAIAVVPQDVVLFNDSIGYNIHYGNLNASWEDVIEASKKAHIHDIIMRLPNQYNTIVGERGLKMSGGEKQRVSLARAILKKAPILLCDEPTSSLDSQTELDIMNNLKEIGKDEEKTCVIIAHRLSTVQDCDMIVVMDNGRVVEQGTHDELISRGGRYSQLLAFQRSHPDNDIDTIEEDITQEILVKGS
jgi:ABC-type transport system involved in Fe-S cluster assembly fused permease/ATPase subunit